MAEINRFKSLDEMTGEVYDNNVAHGWFDSDRSFGDDVALLHSEVSEMFEAYRNGDQTVTTTEDQYDAHSIHAEAADILIRLLDTCFRHGIDLTEAFDAKMIYNRSRPYRHGNKVV
jgi:NTP pyrophosphatase (non-canonical NTP hydrolase)